MARYAVTFTQSYTYEVEAKDEWEAEDFAHTIFKSDMCHPIARTCYDDCEIECLEEDEDDDECNED